MNKIKTFFNVSKTNAVALIVATSLVLVATIGAASAAIVNYTSRVPMGEIGIALLENGEVVTGRDYGSNEEDRGILLGNMLQPGESLQLGRTYPEALSVHNSGYINEYVRVDIYKYWLDADGKKLQTLSPDLIKLNILCDATGYKNGWMLDKEASTTERTVLYYNQLLYSTDPDVGQGGVTVTEAFSDTLMIDSSVAQQVSQTTSKKDGYTTITTTYDYNGVQFRIEVTPLGVQEHNAEDAIWSAWGRKVTVKDGVLSLD